MQKDKCRNPAMESNTVNGGRGKFRAHRSVMWCAVPPDTNL